MFRVNPSEHRRNRSPATVVSRSRSSVSSRSTPTARVMAFVGAAGASAPSPGRRDPGSGVQRPCPVAIHTAIARPEDGRLQAPGQQDDHRAGAPVRECRAGAEQVIVHGLASATDLIDRLFERRGRRQFRRASQTMRLATSPSRWPPRSSATSQIPAVDRSRNASWLFLRTRPTWLPAAARYARGRFSANSSTVADVSSLAVMSQQRAMTSAIAKAA